MCKLKVFIGSSKEGLIIAQELNNILSNLSNKFDFTLWPSIFTPGDYTLESLLKQKDKCDFAVLVATPDDNAKYRGENVKIPRDNIIFELGFFIGCIGKERTFVISDRDKKIKLPTDILGINRLTYSTNQVKIPLHKKLISYLINNYSKINEQSWSYIMTEPSKTLIKLMEEKGVLNKKVISTQIQAFAPQESEFKLIDSYPTYNQKISTEDVKKIFLQFNNPVDRSTVPYIGNLYVQENTFCQWNICGWIQFAENDTKLIWHVHENNLSNKKYYGPIEIDHHKIDYQRFEIHIGREPDEWRLKDINGNILPQKIIKVYM